MAELRRQQQRGVALLIALVAVALGTLLIAGLMDAGQVERARSRNLVRAEQARELAKGMEAWVSRLLQEDWLSQPGVDTRNDIWAAGLPPVDVPGGRVWGLLSDLDGRFDLNALAPAGLPDARAIARFKRLLVLLDLDPAIADAVADWIDSDRQSGPSGAEDARYLARTPAMRAANRPMADLSELRLIEGVDAEVFERLAPHVTALPSPVGINVNTTSVPVLMALVPGLTRDAAERHAGDAGARFSTIQEFRETLLRDGLQVDLIGLKTGSEYFRAEARIELDGLPFRFVSLMHRTPRGSRAVLRSYGRD